MICDVVYQIMPNHLQSKKNKNIYNVAENDSPLQNQPTQPSRPNGTNPGSLSAIIQNISSVSTRRINQIRKIQGQKLWQRNYWEHIIRDEKELNRIRQYIFENPLRWQNDQENPQNWRKKS